MELLTDTEIRELAEIGAENGFGRERTRDALFATINQRFYRGLSVTNVEVDQVRSDLRAMVRIQQHDNQWPLVQWLEEACDRLQRQAEPDQRDRYREILDIVKTRIGMPRDDQTNLTGDPTTKPTPITEKKLRPGELPQRRALRELGPKIPVHGELRITVYENSVTASLQMGDSTETKKGSFAFATLRTETIAELTNYGEKISNIIDSYAALPQSAEWQDEDKAWKRAESEFYSLLEEVKDGLIDSYHRLVGVYGGHLYEALFNGDSVRNLLNTALESSDDQQVIRLFIHIKDERWQPFHWEYLCSFDDENPRFLAADERLVLAVRRDADRGRKPLAKINESPRVLIVVPEFNNGELKLERRELLKTFEEATDRKNLQVILLSNRKEHGDEVEPRLVALQEAKRIVWRSYENEDSLRKALDECKPDILHFICRARNDDLMLKNSRGIPQERKVNQLKRLLTFQPKAVILQVPNVQIEPEKRRGVIDTSLTELMRMIPNLAEIAPIAIGMAFADHFSAKDFNELFYRLVDEGCAIDVAVQRARLRQLENADEGELEGIPILSMTCEDGQLFQYGQEEAAGPSETSNRAESY